MNLQQRKDLLERLGQYLIGQDGEWQEVKQKAFTENRWFIPEFIEQSTRSVAENYLAPEQLQVLINHYKIPQQNDAPKKIGIVMAGNIPMVGFHDLLCVFLTGNIAVIKLSSKDEVLIKHLVSKMISWQENAAEYFIISERLKGCDAYIATGSNNSSRYFEYYFSQYPSIIRRNRTSVAILHGHETKAELDKLADDVYLYFGLGCRNVSKIYVPEGYDFVPLLDAFRKYDHLAQHHKYKNNYDYNLAIHILNNKFYMSNESIILAEEKSLFSPISQLNYEFYNDVEVLKSELNNNDQVQCVVDGREDMGKAQHPGICDYADGVDTMRFLMELTAHEEVRRP